MQGVLRESTRVSEHILLQERMVQPLGHAMHQDEVEQEGGDIAPVDRRVELNLMDLKWEIFYFILFDQTCHPGYYSYF